MKTAFATDLTHSAAILDCGSGAEKLTSIKPRRGAVDVMMFFAMLSSVAASTVFAATSLIG